MAVQISSEQAPNMVFDGAGRYQNADKLVPDLAVGGDGSCSARTQTFSLPQRTEPDVV